jgi:tRNA(fMet)-specific endonuclease VapC
VSLKYLHEMLVGCYRLPVSAKRTAIEKYLFDVIRPSLPILPYDDRAAEWHAAERARLIQIGRTPPFPDGQIIAIAKVHDLILVTINLADYSSFQDVRVEDWRI